MTANLSAEFLKSKPDFEADLSYLRRLNDAEISEGLEPSMDALLERLEARIICERRVVLTRRPDGSTRFDWKGEPPFKDSDRLTVYHGFQEWKHAVLAVKHGLSGQESVPRAYSYEGDNNPKGLFVTLDFETAKQFAHGYDGVAILEFDAKYGELEAPVWPGRGYTVQGELAQQFATGRRHRVQAGRQEARKAARRAALIPDDYAPGVAVSDRPETASLLLNGEFQALFVGHMNPDRVRAVWVRPRGSHSYERYSRREFLKRFGGSDAPKLGLRGGISVEPEERLFQPQDEWNAETFLAGFQKLYAYRDATSEEMKQHALETIKRKARDFGDIYGLSVHYLWPKQTPGFIRWAKKLKLTKAPPAESSQTEARLMEAARPDTNSEGQPIAKTSGAVRAFWAWFGDSKIVDKQGRPLVVHHGTSAKFDVFRAGEFGFHFGSKDAAKLFGASPGYYLRMRNPFKINKDLGGWKPEELLDRLMARVGPVTDEEAADEDPGADEERWHDRDEATRALERRSARLAKTLKGADHGTDDSILRQRRALYRTGASVRKLYEKYGYDGIVYKNEAEGFDLSYIAFRSNQVKRVDNTAFNPDSKRVTEDKVKLPTILSLIERLERLTESAVKWVHQKNDGPTEVMLGDGYILAARTKLPGGKVLETAIDDDRRGSASFSIVTKLIDEYGAREIDVIEGLRDEPSEEDVLKAHKSALEPRLASAKLGPGKVIYAVTRRADDDYYAGPALAVFSTKQQAEASIARAKEGGRSGAHAFKVSEIRLDPGELPD